ncbi:hypothetical protein [Vibrio vulnificus]|uniref:hypothetical protein n=1 Tax=Vibrio vulnificus TaxID=672 RepID=UPI00159478DE|nr:hypothetical protein [Vibrio vulnificus]NVC72606.1 hypothetical protein [Vibrio vulnificus]
MIRKVSDEELMNLVQAPTTQVVNTSPSGGGIRKISDQEALEMGLFSTQDTATSTNEFVPHWSDYVAAVNQGLTLGFSDEMASGLGAMYDYATGSSSELFGTYDERVANARERLAGFREDSPWIAAGSEVAGSIPTAFVAPAVRGFDMANKLRSTGRLAGEGALWGGAVGLGTSDASIMDDPWTVAADTAIGAGTGATLNPALSAGAQGASKLLRPDVRQMATDRAYGVTTPLSERYPNTLGRMQNWMDTSTYGGSRAAIHRSNQYQERAKVALRDLADGSGSAEKTGKAFIDAKDMWQKTNESEFNYLFGELRNRINMDGTVTPTNTLSFLSSERAAYGSATDIANIVEIPSIKRLRKAMEDGEPVSVDALWKLRQELGDSIITGKFGVDDISQAKAKQLYANVSEDLKDAVFLHSDGLTASQFIEVSDSYTAFQNTLSDIQPIFAKSNREPHSPEKVTAELVKRFRDEPTTLRPLRNILDDFGGVFPEQAAGGVLSQTALNRGQIDPTKALERYDISRSKTSPMDNYSPESTYRRDSTSPARVLSNAPVNDYERAIYLARRAESANKRAASDNAMQLLQTNAIPALGGFMAGGPVGAAMTAFAYNGLMYMMRKGLSSEAAVREMDKLIRKVQKGSIDPETLRLMTTMFATDSQDRFSGL